MPPRKYKPSDFKNKNGVYLTRDLFIETAEHNPDQALYTLQPEEYKGYPSLYELYMDSNDATEYTFANTYLGGWEHWQKLCNSSFFKPYIEKWRAELEIKHRSIALAKIMETAKGNGRDALQAAKYIADYSKIRPAGTKGRPSKADIALEARKIADDRKRIEEDFLRLQ